MLCTLIPQDKELFTALPEPPEYKSPLRSSLTHLTIQLELLRPEWPETETDSISITSEHEFQLPSLGQYALHVANSPGSTDAADRRFFGNPLYGLLSHPLL